MLENKTSFYQLVLHVVYIPPFYSMFNKTNESISFLKNLMSKTSEANERHEKLILLMNQ